MAGALFAYYRGFVSVEAFSLYLTIQYVAMIIIGGMGSLLGALLGAVFVTVFPYLIEAALLRLPDAQGYAGAIFAVNYAAFGLVMILFLVFEPLGLVGIWRRIQNYFLLWPFRHRPVAGTAMSERCSRSTSSRWSISAPSPRCRASAWRCEPGQIVAVLGTNGAGKTTTLRAISGFLGIDDARVTEGSVDLQGAADREPAAARDHAPRHRSGSRAREGVSEPHRRGEPRGAGSRRRRANASAARSGLPYFPRLADLRSRIGGLLSGGERQMLAVASALDVRPELLLVDELSLGLAPVVCR